MRFPQPWGEFGDAAGGVVADALKNVDQVGVGVDAGRGRATDGIAYYAARISSTIFNFCGKSVTLAQRDRGIEKAAIAIAIPQPNRQSAPAS